MDKGKHDYEVIFVDVGQGDATIIHKLSNMHSVLIDAGTAVPVLSRLKQSAELEGIFITHWDRDHIGGMPAVIKWLIDQSYKSIDFFINLQSASTAIERHFRRTLHLALEEGVIQVKPACKDLINSVNLINGRISILWPPYGKVITHPDKRNYGSIILNFKVGKFRLLLGGDAKGDVWPNIDSDELKADVLKYPHHGGALRSGDNCWSADELITKVNPDWIVVSVGADNPHGHPSKEFIDAQSKHPEIQFWDTTEGDITLQVESQTGHIKMSKSKPH